MPEPFQTEREAHAFALEFGGPPQEGHLILSSAQNTAMLTKACEMAGRSLGAFEEEILGWLGNFEDSTCGVLARLILGDAATEGGSDDGN
jgi:hypothetical protein